MKRQRIAIGLGLAVITGLGAVALYISSPLTEEPDLPPGMVFRGDSKELAKTVVVPTLDTPMPAGKNVIWCGTFQLAWNRLGDDVIHESPQIEDAEDVVSRLNSSQFSKDALPADSYFAAAGLVKDGIVDEIRREMANHFHRDPRIEAGSGENSILAYAYMQANVPFTIPFFEHTPRFRFIDSRGNAAEVTSFGIRKDSGPDQLRGQPEVLYAATGDSVILEGEFAVDLCRDSMPSQIILALVEPKKSLLATWKDIQKKINDHPPSSRAEKLWSSDTLIVPNVYYDVAHRFAELEGRRLLNRGFQRYFCERAYQAVRFRLDRSGAELASEAELAIPSLGREFVFDQPFLIWMKKRGGEKPFFVMWVDNAELLCKPPVQDPAQPSPTNGNS